MTALQARLFEPLIAVHVTVALAAVVLGATILVLRKGTPTHRAAGRIWVAAMALTALTSLFMAGTVMAVETPIGRFGPIHLLSILTLVTLVRAIRAIRAGRVVAHRAAMVSLYASLVIAGTFTLLPTRILGAWLRAGSGS
jgi:uncharacterized membrane protein